MDVRGYKHYQESSLDTMTSGELLLMLFDGLVKKLIQAELLMEQKQYMQSEQVIDRCVDIIHYLQKTLNRSYPISKDLNKLYEFFCYELMRVKIGHNTVELTRVKKHVTELRDSFKQAEKNVIMENAQSVKQMHGLEQANEGGDAI